MVSKCDHPKLVAADVVDDAEGKLPEKEAASPVSPRWAKLRMIAKEGKRPLELGDERATQINTTFARIEDGFLG